MVDDTEIEEIKSKLKFATFEQLDEICEVINKLKAKLLGREAESVCKLRRWK
jgi:hypothetical protein